MRRKLILAAVSIIASVLLVTTWPTLNPREVSADSGLSYSLQWTKQLDTVTTSSVIRIVITNHNDWESSNTRALILTDRPEIFIVKLKDQTVKYSSGKISTLDQPSTISDFLAGGDDNTDDDKYTAWLTYDATPTLHVYKTSADTHVQITLSYKTDPRPTTISVSKDGKYILIGDETSYIALYERD